MAKLTDPVRIEKNDGIIHQPVYRSEYKVFNAEGSKHIQIDTYGRPHREKPEQISQSIQFDETFAKKLISILKKEFGD